MTYISLKYAHMMQIHKANCRGHFKGHILMGKTIDINFFKNK